MTDAEMPQVSLFFPLSIAILNEDTSPCSRPHSEPPDLYTVLQLVPIGAWPGSGVGDESGSSSTHQAMAVKCHACHEEAPFSNLHKVLPQPQPMIVLGSRKWGAGCWNMHPRCWPSLWLHQEATPVTPAQTGRDSAGPPSRIIALAAPRPPLNSLVFCLPH